MVYARFVSDFKHGCGFTAAKMCVQEEGVGEKANIIFFFFICEYEFNQSIYGF